jgi:hypothetical protein
MVICIGIFYYKDQSRQFIGFVYQCRSVLEKNKGHNLAYDVEIMTSQQRLPRIVTSTFLWDDVY